LKVKKKKKMLKKKKKKKVEEEKKKMSLKFVKRLKSEKCYCSHNWQWPKSSP